MAGLTHLGAPPRTYLEISVILSKSSGDTRFVSLSLDACWLSQAFLFSHSADNVEENGINDTDIHSSSDFRVGWEVFSKYEPLSYASNPPSRHHLLTGASFDIDYPRSRLDPHPPSWSRQPPDFHAGSHPGFAQRTYP